MTDMAALVHTLMRGFKIERERYEKGLGYQNHRRIFIGVLLSFFLPDKRKNFWTLMMGPVDFLIATLGFIFSLFFVLLV